MESRRMAGSVQRGEATTLTLRFTPLQAGRQHSTFRIDSDAIGQSNPFEFTVTGIGRSPFENWQFQHFGNAEDFDDAADLADPNANGIANILEYALGGNPVSAAGEREHLPQAVVSASHTLQLGFFRQMGRSDITLRVQAADSLQGPWENLAESVSGNPFVAQVTGTNVVESGTGSTRAVTVSDKAPMGMSVKGMRFMRVEVTR